MCIHNKIDLVGSSPPPKSATATFQFSCPRYNLYRLSIFHVSSSRLHASLLILLIPYSTQLVWGSTGPGNVEIMYAIMCIITLLQMFGLRAICVYRAARKPLVRDLKKHIVACSTDCPVRTSIHVQQTEQTTTTALKCRLTRRYNKGLNKMN